VINHPLFVIFFMVGTVLFFTGLALRLFLYGRGQWDFRALVRGVLSTLFSQKILEFIRIVFLDGILQRRLFGQDKLRWLMKVLIMIGYPGILIAGHLKAEIMSQFEKVPHLIRFFYAPFCDFYYFRDVSVLSLKMSDALFAISFDLFGAMILTGEFIAIYRRFVAKTVTFKTSVGDILAVNLLGGWFILRFFCEATSILTYSLPAPVAQYWFVSFGLSKIIAPLGLPWSSLNFPLWSLSGLFLGALVAAVPFNKKLWHIITIPLVMFVNLMPEEAFQPGARKASLALSLRELIALDSCVKCGSCVDVCPVFTQTKQLEITMGGFLTNFKSYIRKAYGLPGMFLERIKAKDMLKKYSEHPYLCTLCGRCTMVCPAFIDLKEVRIAAREFVVEKGEHPSVLDRVAETLDRVQNIVGEPMEDRPMWVQALSEVPENMFQKERAHVVYFVGCVASYFPMTKRIPQSFAQILVRAGVDFTLLGGKEWCCGFPMIAAGMKKKVDALMQHNLEKVKEKGAKAVVCTCPSCYHTWKERVHTEIEIFHATQFIEKLIDEGKIRFKGRKTKLTYHDPCDLGRTSGVYDAPRRILKAIPGVDLVELEKNREQCRCCGGGGDLEIVNPDLSASLAQAKIEEVRATGAEVVISACQQCLRTILTTARKKKLPVVAMDITEFVLKNMSE
jgi:heterodisulfide reductase subunit D